MSCSGGQAKNGHGFMPVSDKSLKVIIIEKTVKNTLQLIIIIIVLA